MVISFFIQKWSDLMSLFKDFDDMVEEVKKQRKSILNDSKEIYQRYEEKEEKLKSTFAGSLLEEKTERLEQEKRCEIKKLIIYFQCSVIPLFDKIRTRLDLFIKMSSFDDLDELERISAMPMTKHEFLYIVQKFGNRRNYWNERMLCKIARENNIQFSTCPSVDGMLEIISALEYKCNEFAYGIEKRDTKSILALGNDDSIESLASQFKEYSALNED